MRKLAQDAYQVYVERMGRRPAPMTADYLGAVELGHAWVAQHGDVMVALLILKPAADHLLLDNVAVAPMAQRTGVGSRLLRFAEERALEQGFSEVRLYTNEAMSENLHYYRHRGYRETHRAVDSGFRRVFFSKRLSGSGVDHVRASNRCIPDQCHSAHFIVTPQVEGWSRAGGSGP